MRLNSSQWGHFTALWLWCSMNLQSGLEQVKYWLIVYYYIYSIFQWCSMWQLTDKNWGVTWPSYSKLKKPDSNWQWLSYAKLIFPIVPFTSSISCSLIPYQVLDAAGLPGASCVMTHLFASLSLQVLEMMTTWAGGVEVVVAAALVTEGVEVQERVATEMDPPVEERQTSGNRLKVTPPPVSV